MDNSSSTAQPSPSPASLVTRTNSLRELAEEYKRWQKRAEDIQRFLTRRDELDAIARRIGEAAVAYQALADDPNVRTHMEPAVVIAVRLRSRTKDLLQQVIESPLAILKQKALEPFKMDELNGIEGALHSSWQWFLGASERTGIEAVLTRFPDLRQTATRLARFRVSLQHHGEKLPSGPEDVEEGRRLKKQLADELKSLEGAGLDSAVLAFLRRSLEGVPLVELLADDKVLNWLRENHLTGYFQVRST
jgi:hypothetical protein